MTTDRRFPELVSLACHDLRTPLATVAGFAATLLRTGRLDEQTGRYVTLIESAAGQLGQIIDDLSVAARIEDGRFEPSLEAVDSLELARGAAAGVSAGEVHVEGHGAPVRVDARLATRALTALAGAGLRHGGLQRIELRVDGTTLTLSPINQDSGPVVLGEATLDLGALAGRTVLEALGGRLERRGYVAAISLPAAE
jgi:signal transduction histidine kinase